MLHVELSDFSSAVFPRIAPAWAGVSGLPERLFRLLDSTELGRVVRVQLEFAAVCTRSLFMLNVVQDFHDFVLGLEPLRRGKFAEKFEGKKEP